MRITIIQSRVPPRADINEKIRWFSSSLGLFTVRDKDSSCYRVFIELLKTSRTSNELSSDQIAYSLSLSRGTVMHHMNKLIAAGIVIPQKSGYILRVGNLETLVEELQQDIARSMRALKRMAESIDSELGLE